MFPPHVFPLNHESKGFGVGGGDDGDVDGDGNDDVYADADGVLMGYDESGV